MGVLGMRGRTKMGKLEVEFAVWIATSGRNPRVSSLLLSGFYLVLLSLLPVCSMRRPKVREENFPTRSKSSLSLSLI